MFIVHLTNFTPEQVMKTNGEERCSANFSLASALHAVGGQRHAPAAVPPEKRPGKCCTGCYVGLRTGLDGCLKSLSHRNSIQSPSIP